MENAVINSSYYEAQSYCCLALALLNNYQHPENYQRKSKSSWPRSFTDDSSKRIRLCLVFHDENGIKIKECSYKNKQRKKKARQINACEEKKHKNAFHFSFI